MTVFNRDEVFRAYRNRKSTRQYDPNRKISDADFRYILELGRYSPSSVGSEPWQFIVVQNQAVRDAMNPFAWGMTRALDEASHIVVIAAKKNVRYDSKFLLDSIHRRGITEDNAVRVTVAKYHAFQQDDMCLLQDERYLFDWCCKQTYIALANMMTGAALIGIDSCPIEGFNYAQMNRVLAQAGAFDPAEWGVSVAATFGYRAHDIADKARKAVEDVVVWLK